MHHHNVLNPSEAPNGFYAVLKRDVKTDKLGNICRACDWRPECNKIETDFTNHNHRCMDYGVLSSKDGSVIKRNDGCGVVFKAIA